MKKIVLGLVCAMSFSFATTSEDNQKNVDETLKKLNTKIENLKKQLHSNDSEETIKYWEEEANQGDVTAQFLIARTYYREEDYKKAIEWYEKAANQGHIKAQLELGSLYSEKENTEKDYKKAIKWLEKVANLEITLEDDVVNGKFDELNTLKAVAQNNLGNLYYNGHGVKQDKNKAKELYEKACRGTFFISCENLKNFK